MTSLSETLSRPPKTLVRTPVPSLRIPRAWTTVLLTSALVIGGAVPAQAALAQTVPASAAASATDVTDLVDLFVSTEDDYGQDLPGAQAPNSLVKINPMTTPGRSHTGYDYAEDQIAGFTHTNLDGVGGSGAGGDLLVVPTYVDYTQRPATSSYAKTYSHDAEEAEPGYYSVDLTTTTGTNSSISDAAGVGPIVAEATADVRTGQDRFTFPQAGTASLVVDLANNYTSRRDADLEVTTLSDGRVALSGSMVGYFNGYEYQLSYYAETTTAVSGVRTWGADQTLSSSTKKREGTDIGAILDFDVAAGEQVGLRVAISTISVEQARIDLEAEMGDRSFDEVRADTHDAWEELLGRVAITSSEVSDPDGSLLSLFYTHLYRMLTTPVNATSTSGTYRGVDGSVRQADGYIHYDGWGFWDDFRKYGVLALIYPDLYADMAQSIVDLFVTFGDSGADRLSDVTHSVPTVRFERAAVVIADAIEKGAQLDGLEEAWPGLVAETTGGYANQANVDLGYIANEVDDTLGTAYDDSAMATIAESIGRAEDAAAYRERATNWVNIFQDDVVELSDGMTVGLNMPRSSDGTFADADPERFEAGNVYQGTLWQYNWYMTADMGGLIELMGGEEDTLAALSHMFGEQDPDDGSRMLHSNANEVDLQSPYLFNYVGAPSKTQYWVRSIYTGETWNRYIATGSTGDAPSSGGEFTPPVKTSVYSLDPQGFLPTMDNDTGTMSSMFVSAALGLFPAQMGSDEYQIGTPFFERATITYPSGRSFTVSADGVSEDSFYIQSAELDGASFDRTWVAYDQIASGGELEFTMDSAPSDWGEDSAAAPSLSDEVDSSIYDRDAAVTLSSREFTESSAGDGTIGNTVTLTLSDGAFAGSDGDDLADAIQTSGLPAGLTLSATRVDERTLTLALNGVAEASDSLDSIDDLRLTLTDAVFAQRPASEPSVPALKVTFAGVGLSAERLTMRADAEGVLDDAVILTLNGARFAGEDGRDLIADGDLALRGLPAGLTAEAEKTGPSTVRLRVHGDLAGVEGGSFTLAFSDGAFEGVSAAAVGGDGIGLGAFTISVDQQWRSQLSALYAQVRYVEQGAYSTASFTAFDDARTRAHELLADEGASEKDLRAAYYALEKATGDLGLAQSAYRRLQAESSDDWSGGSLARESSTDSSGASLGNLGGVGDGSWISYGDIDFGDDLPETVTLRYANNSTRCAPDARVELRLDAPDGTLVGTVETPATGSNWNAYATVTHTLADSSVLDGSHTLYLVFRGTTTDALPWIGNFDWVQFAGADDGSATGAVRIEAEGFSASNGNGLKTETSTDDAGDTIGNVGGTWDGGELRYEDVDLSERDYRTLSVRYANNSGRTGADARIEVRLDDAASDPIATVPLPATGTNWNAYRVTTVGLPDGITGTHTLIVTLRATTDSGHPYVANLDWYEFGGADFAALQDAIAEAEALLPQRDRYIAVDFGVFEQALKDASTVAEDATSSQEDVDEALRVLRAAQGQLEWTVIRQLEELVATAEALDTTGYTAASVEALQAAITQAKGLAADAGYEDLTGAYTALREAIDRLVAPTVPARAEAPDAALAGPAEIVVTWDAVTDDGGSPVTEYVVTLRSTTAPTSTTTVDAAQASASFAGLRAGTAYTATVAAVNAVGAGAESEESAPVTTRDAPAPPVADGDDLPDDARDALAITVRDGVATVSGLTPSEWYFLYAYSAPTSVGWFPADADGVVTAALPSLDPGSHRLAVLDADGVLLGWAEFQVAGDIAPTDPGGPPPGGVAGTGGDDLATTGGDVPTAAIVVAVLLLIGGAVVLIARRRRADGGR